MQRHNHRPRKDQKARTKKRRKDASEKHSGDITPPHLSILPEGTLNRLKFGLTARKPLHGT